ncbi:MAG: hypothetical protein M3454_13325 [Actinomycetota bacterium]|nr:hypothetical protein [Actinomycetota bacterium]
MPVTYHHERRLDRALHHLESLKAERAAWREESPHRLWTEFEAESGENVLWADILKPPPARLSLIAGDCIHNLRAALDNLAFELALAYTKERPLPGNIEGKSAFPIFSNDIADDPDLRKNFDRMTRGIGPRAKAYIEELQPYKRGDGFRSDRLWQLNQLSREDKHRLPHAASLNNLSTLTYFVPDNIGHEEVRVLLRNFDNSAPVARYPARDSTGAEVHMNFTAAFDVCFSGRTDKRLWGEPILGTLEGIHRHILRSILPVLTPYLT